jgi:hypothetical protein
MSDNNSESQAKAQYESICEMVAALDRDTAIDAYTSDLSRERCVEMLAEVGIDSSDAESTEDLREAVAENIKDGTIDEPDDFEFDEDEARQTINEDPLSVQVRSGWANSAEEFEPEEFEILLCTGGPACRIVGDIGEHGEPERPRLQHQDWGTPWTEYFDVDREVLLTYCRQFYFGE